eukprot:6181527-Prymnesium_polylepis.3
MNFKRILPSLADSSKSGHHLARLDEVELREAVDVRLVARPPGCQPALVDLVAIAVYFAHDLHPAHDLADGDLPRP